MARLRMRIQLGRARVWRWKLVSLPACEGASYKIYYAGTKEQQWRASALLGLDGIQNGDLAVAARQQPIAIKATSASLAFAPEAVLLSEAPIPGAIRVPWWFDTPVPLKRPMEEILETYNEKLRLRLLKQRGNYRVRQVLSEAEIAEINRSMLVPYAIARHGEHTVGVKLDKVRRIARGDCAGRLDLVEKDGEPVACHLGSELEWKRKRYWIAIRFGFPEKVFNDPKQRSDINSINTFLAMEWAHQHGYDYYDMGGAFAKPENGLMQWKRRRGAGLDLRENEGFFHVRLCRNGAAEFLWDSPLFASEKKGIVLHLGVPVGSNDDGVHQRYREMGYDVVKVYLHCARPPGDRLVVTVRHIFAHLDSPPPIEVVTCS